MPQDKGRASDAGAYVDSFVAELINDYFQYQREVPRNRPKGKFGFCYVDTPLGTLELRLDALLFMTARMLDLIDGRLPGNKTVITDDVVETALEVVDRIPKYVVNDLIGMTMEAQFDLYALHNNKPEIWRALLKRLTSPTADGLKLTLLRTLFEQRGILCLEMDAIRTTFAEVVSAKGVLNKRWREFVSEQFRQKKKRGRPRSTEYDLLFKRRTANPTTETYGKLVRELASAASVPPDVARNRLKSAAAYRRKSLRLG